MKGDLSVLNREGNKEPFSSQKVYKSAINAGASNGLAKEITRRIEKKIYPNIKTSEIFREIKRLLQGDNLRASLRFNLKTAIKKLGPTGFPFEKYIKSILESRGFETKINLFIKGKCCTHEIDFLATKKKETVFIGECKYRNLFEKSVDVSVALYNYARFLDLKDGFFLKQFSDFIIKNVIVTNGKFTTKTIQYSDCNGISLWGWKHPKNEGLEKTIEKNKLYPITILPSLSKKALDFFTSEEKMLASDVLKMGTEKISQKIKIPITQIVKIKKEAEILLN